MRTAFILLVTAAISAILFGFMSFWVQEAAGFLMWIALCGFLTSGTLLAMGTRQQRHRRQRVPQRIH